MKNGGASGLVKQILGGLKTKANAIKARLIVFSLVTNKKFLMSSITEKIHSVLGRHDHTNEECLLEDQSKAIVVYNDNIAHSYEVVPNCGDEEDDDHDDDDDGKYPDLTHTLFETEDVDFGGSVIDMVKNSKEEAGEEFKLEDEIDHVADLFIKKFRRQIVLQKQESLKRFQEMLHRGV